ncbi:DUF4942 domain-containing protein [Gemmata sp.]|uniref:DUF4942 domain-containing protein n=1 Tax=Gemmata sp. TaxID=1914242 RepID=UPI003F72783A
MTTIATIPAGGLTRAHMDSEEFRESVVFMAEEFQDAVASMKASIRSVWEQTRRLNAAFPAERDGYYGSFSVAFEVQHNHRSYGAHDPEGELDALVKHLSRDAWKRLVARIGIKDIMSVAKRKEFEEQLEKGDLPEITAETIMGILFNMADQARDFAAEAAKEVFTLLLPSRREHAKKFKVNSAVQVGRRVVLTWFVQPGYGSERFRVNYRREAEAAALDNMFHVLDGKGIVREGRPPLFEAIRTSADGRAETDYFRCRCFKNGNLHLEFKRMDLVKRLNALGTGEAVIGNEPAKPKRATRPNRPGRAAN